MPASDKTPSKRVTVADLAQRLDSFMEFMTDVASEQDRIEERQEEIVGRLDAQRDGLMAVEERLGAMNVLASMKDAVARSDMQVASALRTQAEMEPDEKACSIDDLMDGGNVAATEGLKFPTHEEVRSQLSELFTDTPEEAEQFYTLLGDERQEDTTEQAILRIATRLYHLERAEEIMESQPQNQDAGVSRAGWTGDAWSDESNLLWPLLYQWAREQGWL